MSDGAAGRRPAPRPCRRRRRRPPRRATATMAASYAAVAANAVRARRRRVDALERARRADLVEDRPVVGRIDDDPDVGVVLGRRPHHRRTADVDQLHARVAGERVQVDDDEGDRLDAVLGHVAPVLGVVEVGEDAAVHLRVQGDDAVAEDRREARDLGDVGDRQSGVGDGGGRAAARQQLPSGVGEAAGEVDDAGLVVHGEQGGGHEGTVTNRCRRARKGRRDAVLGAGGAGRLR